MLDLFNKQQIKNFIKTSGITLTVGYVASFALLVATARTGLVQGGLPGDIFYRVNEKTVVFFPFVSSFVFMLGGFLLIKVIVTFKLTKFIR